MNMDITPNGQQPLSMSSREIAELCDKRHDHILRDIEKMLQDIGDPKFGASSFEAQYTTPQNKQSKEYRLPKDLTFTLITGYRADLRYKVVKRLRELESQSQPAMLSGPQLMAAALVVADATMRAQSVQIEEMREDVAAHERLTKADGSLNITEASKSLGMRPKDLFDWLSHNGWTYKRTGGSGWLGYQTKCNQGLLEHKTTTVLKADGSERITEQVRITAKGLSTLAKVIRPTARLIA